MKTKYHLILIILAFNYCNAFAQTTIADSLFNILKITKEVDKRIKLLNELSWEFSNNNPDTAIEICSQALLLAQNTGAKNLIAACNGLLGVFHYFKADYTTAIDYYLKSLKINEQLNKKSEISTMLGNIGIVYGDIGEQDKALDYYLKALKIDEEIGNKNGVARHTGNIGRVYMSQKNSVKALEYFFKFRKMGEELKVEDYVAIATSNIGLVYLRLEEYPKALQYFQEAIKIEEERGNLAEVARNLGNVGSLYTLTKKYKESFDCLFRGLSMATSTSSRDEIKNDYEELSLLYEKSNIPLRDSVGGKLLTMEEMRLRALHFHKQFIALRDTLWSEENKRQMLQKEMNFEFDKKAVTAKAEQDKKDVLAEVELKRKEQQRNYFIIGFALVAILALYILKGYRQKQKANLLLADKNKIIEEKNKDIMDSIRYAKRIQTSLLPTEKYIERILDEKNKDKTA